MCIARRGAAVVPLVYRGESIGRWSMLAWDPSRFLPSFAERFIDALVASVKRAYPGQELTRRAPPLPKVRLRAG
jgi:hypothetical protein